MLVCLLALARAPVEFAEAEVAVGDEGAHTAGLGERQRLVEVGLAVLGIEPIGMGRDVAEEMVRVSRGSGVARTELDRAISLVPRYVEPTQQETGAPQRVIGTAVFADPSLRRLLLEEPLTFLDSTLRFACFIELGQDPGGGGGRIREQQDDVSGAEGGNPLLDERMRLRPVCSEKAESTRVKVCLTDAEGAMCRLGESDRVGLVPSRLGESAEMRQAQGESDVHLDQWQRGAAQELVDQIGGKRRDVLGGVRDHLLVVAALI